MMMRKGWIKGELKTTKTHHFCLLQCSSHCQGKAVVASQCVCGLGSKDEIGKVEVALKPKMSKQTLITVSAVVILLLTIAVALLDFEAW